MMNVQPFSKELFDLCKNAGIKSVELRFSGGSDQGYLDINIQPYECSSEKLLQKIEDWTWSVYFYSGAGDGSDYGDNITYNFETGKVETESWYSEPQSEYGQEDLVIDDKKE